MTRPPRFAAIFFALTSLAFPADELPVAPAGWKVELVAKPPVLIHPSVVTCAPDGRVFVAQDPIDMSLPSDSAGDSILCIHPDGHITKFAGNLHAVFGLLYLDGKLYVHHVPVFSVFTDDHGIGRDRRDLFTTNPNPNNAGKGMNDHVPSAVRAGMDGWLYMSTGDRGIYGAVGRDGSKVDLHGGGIMRFRPDSTQLEIYASGTRNHLDIAINAEEEMFTYDNTDDGNGWWTRVTHMVDGGSYGYPFNYKPRRPDTLWMMTDYGGGAGTGAVAYNEDALPAEYRGDLFVEDWARKQVLRLKVSREGATFKIDERTQTAGKDFLTQGGTTEFRPVGIAVSTDGLSFYIADWNYGGWRSKTVAGRLLKVTYAGPSLAAPKPTWWIAAGSGKPFKASEAELIAALKHPAQSVRLVAQRRLADRGQAAIAPLKMLLRDTTAPAHARWHAVWALDAIDAGASARAEFLALVAANGDASVRAQIIRQLGTRRVAVAIPALTTALRDADPVVRFRAATALGRIGNVDAVPALTAALDEKDFFTRYAIFAALHRIGIAQPAAWPQIAKGFSSDQAAVREGTLYAMKETPDAANVEALAHVITAPETPPDSRVAALGALAELHRLPAPWDGKWWGTQPVLREKPIPKTLTWTKTAVVLKTIRGALQSPDESVRRAAIQAVATAQDTAAGTELRAMFGRESSTDLRRAILHTLGTIKDPETGELTSRSMDDSALRDDAIAVAGQLGDHASVAALTRLADAGGDPELLTRVLEAFGAAKIESTVPTISRFLSHDDAHVRAAASQALGSIGGDAAFERVFPLLDSANVEVRRAAIVTAGLLKDKRALPKLIALAGEAATESDAANALTAMPDLRALDVYLAALGRAHPRADPKLVLAITAIKEPALLHIEAIHRKKPFTGAGLSALQRIYSRSEQALAGPLFEGASKPVDPAAYLKFAMHGQGDATRGRRLFESAACVACHRINGSGGQIGPDLSDVATKYDRAFLIESVLSPSKQILDGYHSTTLTLRNGETLSGFLRSETSSDIVLVDAAAQKHVVPKSDVVKNEQMNVSVMPEGLFSSLSLAEFSDLIGYLESLKEKPSP